MTLPQEPVTASRAPKTRQGMRELIIAPVHIGQGSSVTYIVQADISPRALLAVDGDGNIRSRFFRESDSVEFPVSGRAVLCGAGTEHYVFVLEDGSLAAFGDNSYGQCDVQKLAAKAAKD